MKGKKVIIHILATFDFHSNADFFQSVNLSSSFLCGFGKCIVEAAYCSYFRTETN
jgi:hypothetical protein